MSQDDRGGDGQQVFYQMVGVSGEVTVTPQLECGPITVTCLETNVSRGRTSTDKSWRPSGDGKCRLTIFQELCVAIPVTFTAKSECRLTDVQCGNAATDPGVCFCDDSDSDSDTDPSRSSGSNSSLSSSLSSSSSSSLTEDGSDSSDSSYDEE